MKLFLLLSHLVLTAAVATAGRGQALPGVDALVAAVGDRVGAFYERARSVICTEVSTVQPIDSSHSPQGFARTVESELRVENRDDGSGEAAMVRKVHKVNGRPPRDQDRTDRAGCTDPNPISPEPLAFLLPKHRADYQFRTAGLTKERNRAAIMIDFASANRRSRAVLIDAATGHDDCFDWSGHIASRGRVWVDADTHDVLRVERGLTGPVDVTVPALIQRRHRLDGWVVIVRDQTTIRYTRVVFTDPDEVLLLPESVESVTIIRGGLQSTRRTQTFTDYRRFVTDGRVLQ